MLHLVEVFQAHHALAECALVLRAQVRDGVSAAARQQICHNVINLKYGVKGWGY